MFDNKYKYTPKELQIRDLNNRIYNVRRIIPMLAEVEKYDPLKDDFLDESDLMMSHKAALRALNTLRETLTRLREQRTELLLFELLTDDDISETFKFKY